MTIIRKAEFLADYEPALGCVLNFTGESRQTGCVRNEQLRLKANAAAARFSMVIPALPRGLHVGAQRLIPLALARLPGGYPRRAVRCATRRQRRFQQS